MPIDLSGLSNEALQQMYAAQQNIQKLESNNAPDTSTITNPTSGAQGSMQVMPATQGSPGFGVTPSNGTPQDTAREGRDYLAALTMKYKNPLYAAMAYNWGPGNMDKWIASGSDMSKVPDETLKYAYAHAQAGSGSTMGASAQASSSQGTGAPMGFNQPQDLSKMSDEDLKALHAKQQSGGFMENVKGAGLQAANLAAMGLEALPIAGAAAIGLGRRALEGQSLEQNLHNTVEQGFQNFQTFSPENALEKLGVDTSGVKQTAGYQIPGKVMNFLGETVPSLIGQGLAMESVGYNMDQYDPREGEKGKELIQGMMLLSPLAELHLPRGVEVSGDLGQKLATGDWDQPGTVPANMGPNEGPQRAPFIAGPNGVSTGLPLTEEQFWAKRAADIQASAQAIQGAQMGPNQGPQMPGGMRPNMGPQLRNQAQRDAAAAAAAVGPEMPPNMGPQIPNAQAFARGIMQPFEPNMGPQRPPMSIDQNGIVRNPLESVGQAAFNEGAQEHIDAIQDRSVGFAQQQAGDLFPSTDTTGFASPYEPNREALVTPYNAEERASTQGQPQLDPMAQRVSSFVEAVQSGHEFTQGDFFNDLDQRRPDQFGPDEEPRTLNQNEFQQTMEALASQVDNQGRPKTGFEMPEDPEKAYNRYLETVSDTQGGLFDRPTIAKNFVDAARAEAVAHYVDNHPIVKANQAKLDQAQARLDNALDGQTRMGAAGDLKRAQDLLDRSKENIGKFYQGDGRFGAYEKDGIIYMNSGVPIPDWVKKGLVNILKSLHGVVVDFSDRMMQKLRNINSTAKLIDQGMRKSVNDRNSKSVDVRQNQKAVDMIKSAPGLSAADRIREWVPDDRPYEEVKPELQAASDMDSNWFTKNITAQGGVWASAMSKNPAVKWAYTHIQNALKQADFHSRELLTNNKDGLRTLAQGLNSRELGEIYTRLDMDEGLNERTPNELKQMGFNDKQIALHQRFRNVMDQVYKQLNEGLKRAGMPEVDRRLAYMTSRFLGDFRSMVYQKGTKRPLGFIGANNKWEVEGIKAKLEEQFPGKYDFEPTSLNRGPQGRTGPNMFQGYLNVLNHFQMNDPEMKAIMDTYRDYFTNNAAKAMNMLKHTKDKTGIMGAEGRKLWESQERNAVEGMKSQLTYADHALRWSALQEAASKVKQLMEDPEVDMPNAKSYIKDYMGQAMGQTTSGFAGALNGVLDGVAERTGVGPSVFRGMNKFQKSALLQLWLGFLRLPHSILTMTQFLQSNPAMAELARSRGAGNFWANSYKGLGSTMQMAMKALNPDHELRGFDKDIWDYQQKNQVFNANLTSHLTDVNSTKVGRGFRHIMEANITYPEAAIRSSTFSIWAHTFKESGMSTKEALGTAENMTRGALVDYRPSERPLVFGKMGMMGDIASTLTRFRMNQISQHQYFGKEAIGNKNASPMGALLLSSIAFAGLSGVIGFNYADQLYQMISNRVFDKPDTLKALLLRNLPDWANYGLMAQLGINMQGSFSNADTIPDNPLAVLFPTGNTIFDMVKSVGQAAYYHDETSAKKLLYNFSPTSVKGFEENNMFSKDAGNGNKLFINPNTEKAQSIRTPAQQKVRDLAFHPIEEARQNDVAMASKEINSMYSDRRESDLKRIEHQFAQGTVTPEKMASFRDSWVSHRGDAGAASQIVEYLRNQKLTDVQREELAGAQGNIQAKRSLQDIFAMQGRKR